MEPKIFIIDLFCGAGGTSTGASMAHDKVRIAACVNHDKNALISHAANHPGVLHFFEDIRVLAMIRLRILVAELRKDNPGCKIHLWASLECTNHSKAKGGLPRDADSRTLALHLFRYIDALSPDKIWIENVSEFLIWGPLDELGKPILEFKGRDYRKWVNSVCKRRYKYEYKILNSAHYGAYTSRKRYFGQFTRYGEPFVWPEPTHGKGLLPLNPVKDVLDFSNEGQSIFTRKKPLVEATLTRIYHGLEKFVANGDPNFLAKYYGTGKNIESIHGPCGTVTTKDRFQCIQTIPNIVGRFLMNPQFSSKGGSIDNPCFTLIARMDKSPPYLITAEEGVPKRTPIESEMMGKIVAFMFKHGIADIKMRMLEIDELLQIQGFPKTYKLYGTKTEQKKYIGNAVERNQATAIYKADYTHLLLAS